MNKKKHINDFLKIKKKLSKLITKIVINMIKNYYYLNIARGVKQRGDEKDQQHCPHHLAFIMSRY